MTKLPDTITIAGVEYRRKRGPNGEPRMIWDTGTGTGTCLERAGGKRWRHCGPLVQCPVGTFWNGPWETSPDAAFRAAYEHTLSKMSDEYTRKRDAILKVLVMLDKGEDE